MTFAESVTFVLTLSFLDNWQIILGLLIGGAIAAPMAVILTKKLPVKTLMFIVGSFIIGVSIRTVMLALL